MLLDQIVLHGVLTGADAYVSLALHTVGDE